VKVARRVLRGPRRSNAPGLPDWRIGGEKAWLWVATTDDATFYDVARGRGFEQATGLVPADYAGVIVRDGWVVYNSYDKAAHQSCVAHLVRRCHEMIEDQPAWTRSTPRRIKDLRSRLSTPGTLTSKAVPPP